MEEVRYHRQKKKQYEKLIKELKQDVKEIKKNFMAPFYRWGSTASSLHSHYEEAVYFLPISSPKFLALMN